jgi:hypothetical protein
MRKEDIPCIGFITHDGTYYYRTMLFRLKNVGATYQRTKHAAFSYQIGRNTEVYIDDLVIKSMEKDNLIPDLEQTFQNLRRYRIMLNRTKCIFGVEEAKILGYLVSTGGSKAIRRREKLS